jgi:hypothetical protein
LAEALGAAASIAGLASLALQLGGSIVKLKRFCDSVREAPEELRDTIREIETLRLVFRGLEQEQEFVPSLAWTLIATCVTPCVRQAEKIAEITDVLDQSTRKNGLVGAVKAALKQNQLQELFAKLERAKVSLMFAYQVLSADYHSQKLAQQGQMLERYERGLTALSTGVAMVPHHVEGVLSRHLAQRRELSGSEAMDPATSTRHAPTCTNKDGGLAVTQQMHSRRRRKPKGQTAYKFRIPVWFTQCTWDISMARANRGWDVRLRIWNTARSPGIFALCLEGDTEGVQRMIADGEATMFDRDYRNQMLLQVSVFDLVEA